MAGVNESCSLCRYFWELDAIDGECRRHAPFAETSDELSGRAKWPVVLAKEWCGEYMAAYRPTPREDEPSDELPS